MEKNKMGFQALSKNELGIKQLSYATKQFHISAANSYDETIKPKVSTPSWATSHTGHTLFSFSGRQ